MFLVLYALAFLDRQVLSLLVDPIRADLKISDFQVSILQGGAFVLFFVLCALPIGWAVDRYPRRVIIFLGITVWSLAAAGGGLARNYWHLLLSRFGVGAGEASLSPSAYSILSDLFPRERLAGAMAVFSSGAAVGGAISLALGGYIVALAKGAGTMTAPLVGEIRPWQLVFLLTGLPGLVLGVLVFLVREPQRRGRLAAMQGHEDGPGKSSILRFMAPRRGFYIAHILGFSFFNLMAAGYVNWAPSFLMRTYHWPVQRVGLVLGLMSLTCGVSGMLGSGFVVDRLFRRGLHDAHLRYYAWGSAICAAAGAGATLAPNVALALAGMVVVQLIIPFIAVAAAALQITTPNEYRGRISALFLFVYNIVGFGLGPSIMAGISDFGLGGHGSIGPAMALTFAIFGPLTALTFALGTRPMRRAVASAEQWAET